MYIHICLRNILYRYMPSPKLLRQRARTGEGQGALAIQRPHRFEKPFVLDKTLKNKKRLSIFGTKMVSTCFYHRFCPVSSCFCPHRVPGAGAAEHPQHLAAGAVESPG